MGRGRGGGLRRYQEVRGKGEKRDVRARIPELWILIVF